MVDIVICISFGVLAHRSSAYWPVIGTKNEAYPCVEGLSALLRASSHVLLISLRMPNNLAYLATFDDRAK